MNNNIKTIILLNVKIIFAHILILIFFILNTANALIKEDLYNAEMKITSRDIGLEQRKKFTEQAFDDVLQKITGKPKVLDIQTADKYLSTYAYSDAEDNQIILKISFDKNFVNQSLTDNKQQFLGEYRPLTIVWLKSGATQTEDTQELLHQIVALSKLKGLSIIYPMFDLEELVILQQGIDNETSSSLIRQASKRYSADEIIFAEYSKNNDVLQFSWKSLINNWQFNTDGTDNITHANLFIDRLMENFIKIYAVDNHVPVEREMVLIKITNVINLEDYVRIENYLQNLTFIKKMQATKFQAGEVEFELVANGGKEAIRKAMASNNMLQENFNKDPVDNNILLYTLQT